MAEEEQQPQQQPLQPQDPDAASVLAAARDGSVEAVRALLDARPELVHAARHDTMAQPLHEAAGGGHAGVCELLLSRGADVEATDTESFTPLLYAAAMGSLRVCRLLMSSGARLDCHDTYGSNLLHRAADGGLTELCGELIDAHGFRAADVSALGESTLFYAARGGFTDTCALLLDRGARASQRSELGETALHAAVSCDEPSARLARLVLEDGVDVNAADDAGRTAMHCAATNGDLAVCDVLQRFGADPNARDGDGATPLHLLAPSEVHGAAGACEFLLSCGAAAEATDDAGLTPLEIARAAGDGAEATAAVLEAWVAGTHPLQARARAAASVLADRARMVPDVAALCASYVAAGVCEFAPANKRRRMG